MSSVPVARFVQKQPTGKNDLSPLLVAPHVLHAAPRSLAPGTHFELLVDKDDCNVRPRRQTDACGTRRDTAAIRTEAQKSLLREHHQFLNAKTVPP